MDKTLDRVRSKGRTPQIYHFMLGDMLSPEIGICILRRMYVYEMIWYCVVDMIQTWN